MKKFMIILAVLMTGVCCSHAQSLSVYFELIPEAQLPILRADMRKGMVGMYELGQRPAKVPNLLNGTCVLDTLSDTYLSMHTTDVSTLSIKMLPMKVDSCNVLAVVHTVKVEGTEDSTIDFFTNTWSKLDGDKYFTRPTARDFYQPNDSVTADELEKLCHPVLISYTLEGEHVKATLDPEKYLPKELFQKIKPALKKSLDYNLVSEKPAAE